MNIMRLSRSSLAKLKKFLGIDLNKAYKPIFSDSYTFV